MTTALPAFGQEQIRQSWFYAGIGSRATPDRMMATLTKCARRLEGRGFVLRSGGAAGSDSAFEAGTSARAREIYLPKPRFNDNNSALHSLPRIGQAITLASTIHPAWGRVAQEHQALHGRNIFQILGAEMDEPVRFVLCYTPDGAQELDEITRSTGGTGLAIRLARLLGIPVFNIARKDSLNQLAALLDVTDDPPPWHARWHWHDDGAFPQRNGTHVAVFGSNLAGIHGAGAAKAALAHGAVMGCGEGLMGDSYALPTKATPSRTLPIQAIAGHVHRFLSVARTMPQRTFIVSRVGCGLAGYSDHDIAPLFAGAPSNVSFARPWQSTLCPEPAC